MERILLGVIFLSGWFVLSTCLRQFHFVNKLKTWNEAQSYCRENYTDLATIESSEEMDQLINTAPSYSGDTWIGLYGEIKWRWSDDYRGSGADYRNWESAAIEPDFYHGGQCCVVHRDGGAWWEDFCNNEYSFICYNGTQLNPEFVAVNERMNWSNAQRYCRENFIDLATVRNHTEVQEIQSLVTSGVGAWIGLFSDPPFYWSDGSSYFFSFWDSSTNSLGSTTVVCGYVVLQGSGKWKLISCDLRLPFVCYKSIPAPAPVRKQVVQLKIKLGDGSVDLNDPAVKAGILKKLQDRMQKEAGSGVTLKWREQSDGKVFHKEGKGPQKKQRKKTEL